MESEDKVILHRASRDIERGDYVVWDRRSSDGLIFDETIKTFSGVTVYRSYLVNANGTTKQESGGFEKD